MIDAGGFSRYTDNVHASFIRAAAELTCSFGHPSEQRIGERRSVGYDPSVSVVFHGDSDRQVGCGFIFADRFEQKLCTLFTDSSCVSPDGIQRISVL